MSEQQTALPIDVQRCLTMLDEMTASAPRPTLCESCARAGELRCGYCENADWMSRAAMLLEHSAAIMRSYTVPVVSPGDLRARIEQLRERNAKDKAAYDWRGGYDNALCDVLALLGAAQEQP